MNKHIDKWLPHAFTAIDNPDNQLKVTDGSIPSQYNGYIASFGAAVIQSGLLAALAFNCNAEANSEEDRTKLMKAIHQMVRDCRKDTGDRKKDLLQYALATSDKAALRRDIMRAATALKLAMRTYKKKKTNEYA
ncbi:MAG: type III-B CRISPR module-associated protein Cmr5 [Cyclobacteriaceae bacterium]